MKPAEEYIYNQKEPYRSILMHIKAVIEIIFPDAGLQYKWKIPCFYIGKRPLCYLNQTKNYVDVGIWHSAYLTKHLDKLVSKDRKVVKSLRYYSLEDIEDDVLIDVLKEAYEVHEKSFFQEVVELDFG